MRRGVFVTGAAGFVGRRLVQHLIAAGERVVALDRSGRLPSLDGLTIVRGDLLEPATYRDALGSCAAVVHLAAATGKAPAAEHQRVNVHGTEILLEECRRAAVQKFVFVSSIAAAFPDVSGYPYAKAKQQAEQAVRASGLRTAILRPTMILGPGAPLLAPLEKLAGLPAIVVPGSGRPRVQPIHVDDMARAIATVLERDLLSGHTFEIGGADIVTFEELLLAVRRSRTGSGARTVRVPLALLRPPLRLAESVGLGRLLPTTAGQLSSFEWDGVATPNVLQSELAAGLVGIPGMLPSQNDTGSRSDNLASTTPGVVWDAGELALECRVFTRHLIGGDPDEHVTAKYVGAHEMLPALAPRLSVDGALLRFARRGAFAARLADSYAAFFAPASALRKKLVLLVAILETSRASYQAIDAPMGGSTVGAVIRLGMTGAGAVATLALGTLILGPLHLAAGTGDKVPR
jgi:nucleoside-diphosphate-sugar epimerase